MAVLWSETFESLADATVISASNSIFDQVTGASCTVEDALAYAGTKCVAIGSGNCTMERSFTGEGLLWAAFAFRMSSAPPANATLLNTYAAGVVVGNLRLTTARQLNFRDAAATRWTSTAVLALDTWYEIHVRFDPAADEAEVKIYDAAGTLLEASPTQTMSNVATAVVDEFRLGNLSGAVAYSSFMDRIIFDDADEPLTLAAEGGGGGTTSFLFYDTGTDWVDVSDQLYYDDGTDWVPVGIS